MLTRSVLHRDMQEFLKLMRATRQDKSWNADANEVGPALVRLVGVP